MTTPSTDPDGWRALASGGGRRLRRIYRTLLAVTLPVLVLILGFVGYATVVGRGDTPTLLTGGLIITASGVCLVVALVRGNAGIRDDHVAVPAARGSAAVARPGAWIGWAGAPAILAVGVLRHYQHADHALLQGVIIAAAALIPAVGNDGARKIARSLTT